MPLVGNLKLPAPFKIFLALFVGWGEGFRSSDEGIWSTAAWSLALPAGPLKARPWEERKMHKEAGVPEQRGATRALGATQSRGGAFGGHPRARMNEVPRKDPKTVFS